MSRILLVILITLFIVTSLFAQWQHSPAGTALVSGMASDSAGQRLFAGVGNGGLWRSLDAGTTWEPFSTAINPAGRFNVTNLITTSPAGDTMICTALREYECWNTYTFDGGLTWHEFDPPVQCAPSFLISRLNHDLWLAIAENHIRRSLNAGQTWNQMQFDGDAWALHPDLLEDSTFYATGFYDPLWGPAEAGLWRSTDLGATWQPLLTDNILPGVSWAIISDILRMSNGQLLASGTFQTSQSGIRRRLLLSTDNGMTWSWVEGYPDHISHDYQIENMLVEALSAPGRIFVTYADVPCGVLRSDDYGQTWLPAAHGLLEANRVAATIFQNEVSGQLYASTAVGIFRSDDSGDTWNTITSVPAGMPYHDFILNDETVILYEPRSASQYQLEGPFTQWQLISLPDQHQGDTVFFFDFPVMSTSGSQLYSMATAFWIDQGEWNYSSRTARSEDNGITWIVGESEAPLLWEHVTSTFVNGNITRWMAVETWPALTGILYMSEDLGDSWSQIGTFAADIYSIHQTPTATYAMTETPTSNDVLVNRTTDLGGTWEQLDTFAVGQRLTFLGDTIIARHDHDCILWNGSAWEVRGPLPLSPEGYTPIMTAIPVDPPLIVAHHQNPAALWLSGDLGMTWQMRTYELPYANQMWGPQFLTFDNHRERLWATTGMGTYYLDAAELSANGPLVFKPADYSLLSVYPNPFNSETSIRFDLLKREQVSVKVYDVLGREVQTLVDEWRDAGRHEVKLSLSEAASGLYFVRIQTPEHAKTQKIVLMK